MMGQQRGFDYTDAQIQEYESLGGTPFLDMEYTVFGELISGFNVLDKIAAVKKNNFDRPNIDVHMKMKLIK
jgi:peptidyl-prolyl cis-trans isomerase B (cyclophilin B)